ncbi:MAG: DUF370 domain-containing protein [Oscillospiraceae bacterium]|nr:DUF370 domain-containing protein [Oscillospiraceae bacterium]
MFLHIGRGKLIPKSSIIGVFDLEITSQSKRTMAFLAQKEKANHVINVCDDIPRSFIVCRDGNRERVFISQISSTTLQKRCEQLIDEEM